jgi:hypothetical protein
VSRKNRDHDVTLDRIDPALGYVSGNVALVTRRANGAKNRLPLNVFILLCEQVAAEAKRGRRRAPAPVIWPRTPWWRWFCWRSRRRSYALHR